MKRIMIAAMESGSGKTVMTCALMRAFQKRGLSVCGFKCGPDYIDPMFHKKVLSAPSRNLDVFLQGEARLKRTVCSCREDIAVIESAMGLYDGIGYSHEGSGWHVALITETPIILVVKPGGSALTLAAQIKGMLDFRSNSRIEGVLLTGCGKGRYQQLKDSIETETQLPVFGYLPKIEEASLPSRHLGLFTAEEIEDLDRRIDSMAVVLEENADIDEIIRVAGLAPEIGLPAIDIAVVADNNEKVSIAVARDDAFSFYYEENIEALLNAGAKIIYFSPISDNELPKAEGMYLGGGYPELFLKELSENISMRMSVKKAVESGMPTVAECGGFMYLQESITDEGGRTYPMAGALSGQSHNIGKLTRFGYVYLETEKESMLFRTGETIPAHEFHYWDSTITGDDLAARKPSGKEWRCGVTTDSLYAGFPHLYLDGEINLARRFVEKAFKYGESKHGSI